MRNRLGSGKPRANGGTELTLIGYFIIMANDAMLVQQVNGSSDSEIALVTGIISKGVGMISVSNWSSAAVFYFAESLYFSGNYNSPTTCYMYYGASSGFTPGNGISSTITRIAITVKTNGMYSSYMQTTRNSANVTMTCTSTSGIITAECNDNYAKNLPGTLYAFIA